MLVLLIQPTFDLSKLTKDQLKFEKRRKLDSALKNLKCAITELQKIESFLTGLLTDRDAAAAAAASDPCADRLAAWQALEGQRATAQVALTAMQGTVNDLVTAVGIAQQEYYGYPCP